MQTEKRPILTTESPALIQGVQVRLIQPQERAAFDELIGQQHYLQSAHLVGEQLRYVAHYQGQWVALLSWSAAAYHLKLREAWIGWTVGQKKRRLPLVANNSRFLILKEFHVPNLASRVMKLCLGRLSVDWQQTYGHEILVVETFVDSQLFMGTSYKASGWTRLGQTQGSQRDREDFYLPHGRPKQLWVRELRPGARTILRGRNLPAGLRALDEKHPPDCPVAAEQLQAMRGFFAGLPEWRTGKCDFTLEVLVTVAVCALLSQVCLGQRDLAAFAANLTRQQMAALDFPREGKPARFRPPGETTFFRLLSQLDSRSLEKALLAWQNHLLGRRDATHDLVAVDGKELLNSQGAQIVSAYSVRDGRWLGSEAVKAGSNEIPAAQQLLRRLDLDGSLVVADALHTQTETAKIIVQEKGGDYLLTVKRNQKTVNENIKQLYQNLTHAFGPSVEKKLHPNL